MSSDAGHGWAGGTRSDSLQSDAAEEAPQEWERDGESACVLVRLGQGRALLSHAATTGMARVRRSLCRSDRLSLRRPTHLLLSPFMTRKGARGWGC